MLPICIACQQRWGCWIDCIATRESRYRCRGNSIGVKTILFTKNQGLKCNVYLFVADAKPFVDADAILAGSSLDSTVCHRVSGVKYTVLYFNNRNVTRGRQLFYFVLIFYIIFLSNICKTIKWKEELYSLLLIDKR